MRHFIFGLALALILALQPALAATGMYQFSARPFHYLEADLTTYSASGVGRMAGGSLGASAEFADRFLLSYKWNRNWKNSDTSIHYTRQSLGAGLSHRFNRDHLVYGKYYLLWDRLDTRHGSVSNDGNLIELSYRYLLRWDVAFNGSLLFEDMDGLDRTNGFAVGVDLYTTEHNGYYLEWRDVNESRFSIGYRLRF